MKKIFEPLKKELEQFDSEREVLIKRSREILKASKAAIYAGHRGDIKGALALLSEAKKVKLELDKRIGEDAKLVAVGAYQEGVQEYAEAEIFLAFLQKKDIPSADAIGVGAEGYLEGMCDATGELSRRAVNAVLEGNVKLMKEIKTKVSEIYEHLMMFDFRNSPLRSKFDRVKGNLERIEDIALKVHLRE